MALIIALLPGTDAFASGGPTGGAGIALPGIGGYSGTAGPGAPAPGSLVHGRWVQGVTVTEYWPAPESWFVGRLVSAPGIPGRHRIDWLYSAMGMSMQGDGIGLDGRVYHIDAVGNGGWVTAAGRLTSAAANWSGGSPFWRAGGYWRNRSGGVTFPLLSGGWSAGRGGRYVPISGVSFGVGNSLALAPYQSIAVDPRIIPLGSRVFVPAYSQDGHGGWFVAQDTGGAINGRHIDIYRSPPASASDPGRYLAAARIYVIKPPR